MEKRERQTTDKSRAMGLAPRCGEAPKHTTPERTCVLRVLARYKICALTSTFPEKWLLDALCYQILGLQIYHQALYGFVVELPGFVSIEEARTLTEWERQKCPSVVPPPARALP
ncbi:hypothetical protein ISCGN_007558 [Ixodes scapularis]